MPSVDAALASSRSAYAADRPRSAALYEAAQQALPGGNTRSVLHFMPFPVAVASGEGAELRDVDGHRYVDFVGEMSAGLFGHTDARILAAVQAVLADGFVFGAPTEREAILAGLVQARFPSLEQLRFCNSGTEANVFALLTARAFTGRRKVLVFDGAYHGSVLSYGADSPFNLPFEVVRARFNDLEDATRQAEDVDLAAIIVEPVLGAAGNIPGEADFLTGLRGLADANGALLVFDEVKTSRLGAGGVQGLLGLKPDLTTLGKYICGGFSGAAFGGRRDIMQRFDPRRADAWKHAGTMNNNVVSMAAGIAAFAEVFTASAASAFQLRAERFRGRLDAWATERGLPVRFIGLGSMFSPHFTRGVIREPAHISQASRQLSQLLHMECLRRGVMLMSRGDIFLSLPMTDAHLVALEAALAAFADDFGDLIRTTVEYGVEPA